MLPEPAESWEAYWQRQGCGDGNGDGVIKIKYRENKGKDGNVRPSALMKLGEKGFVNRGWEAIQQVPEYIAYMREAKKHNLSTDFKNKKECHATLLTFCNRGIRVPRKGAAKEVLVPDGHTRSKETTSIFSSQFSPSSFKATPWKEIEQNAIYVEYIRVAASSGLKTDFRNKEQWYQQLLLFNTPHGVAIYGDGKDDVFYDKDSDDEYDEDEGKDEIVDDEDLERMEEPEMEEVREKEEEPERKDRSSKFDKFDIDIHQKRIRQF